MPGVCWHSWQRLGRLMAGHKPGDLLDQVDTLETNIATSLPAYF